MARNAMAYIKIPKKLQLIYMELTHIANTNTEKDKVQHTIMELVIFCKLYCYIFPYPTIYL